MNRFQFRDDLTSADVAFDAFGSTREELFRNAAAALLKVMLDQPEALLEKEERRFALRSELGDEGEATEELLHEFLQRLVYYKDADEILLAVKSLRFEKKPGETLLEVDAVGEKIDPPLKALGALGTDVKGVTQHHFGITRSDSQWKATIVLDI